MKADDWNQRYQGAQLAWVGRPNRFLAQETTGLEPGRALDLACGAGRHTVWLAELGWQAHGLDFSDVAIDQARQLATQRSVEAGFDVADLMSWEPAGQQWDLVIVFYLQLPADERRAVMRKAAMAVAPGGTFLLVGHDTRNLARGHGGPKSIEVLYTADEIVEDIDGSGLQIERAESVQRPVEAIEGPRVAIDAFVRARRPVAA